MNRELEIREALDASEEALNHLYRARDRLDSAEAWGLWDLFGGGFLSTLVKHDRMDEARRELDLAKAAVRRFGRELRDIDSVDGTLPGTGEFLRFADFFLDGLLADWLMQARIRTTQQQVDDAIRQIGDLRRRLTVLLS